VGENSCGLVQLELLWKETAWSFTAGITVKRSSFGYLLLELLWAKTAVV
jgi:hypothetical protein